MNIIFWIHFMTKSSMYFNNEKLNLKVKKPAEAEKYRLEKIAEAQAKKVEQHKNWIFNVINIGSISISILAQSKAVEQHQNWVFNIINIGSISIQYWYNIGTLKYPKLPLSTLKYLKYLEYSSL